MKYLYLARKHGARVAVVNPYREPGLDQYWVPSNVESAMFGTQMTDEFFAVDTGGDLAFVNGVLKVLVEGKIDERFVAEHTTGFDDLVAALDAQSFAELEQQSGTTRADMERFAQMYASARSAVLIWSMGITQHEHGTDNVLAIANLGLVRGNVGKPGAGLMPIRGHSGVQGGAEMGAYATALARRARRERGERRGAEPSSTDSRSAIGPASRSRTCSSRPGPATSTSSTRRAATSSRCCRPPTSWSRRSATVPVRVHQDIVLTSQMLVDPADVVVLLPAATRYEQRGGGTETTTERRIAYSPEIRGPRPGEVRSEWEIYVDLARRVDPARAHLMQFSSGDEIRREIARVVPLYAGIETLHTTGDSVQWGGRCSARAASSRCPTAGRASCRSRRPTGRCPTGCSA